MPRDLLAKLGHDGAGVELADFASKRVPEGLRRLHQFLELDALLRPERGLTEMIVVRESVPGLYPGRGVDRLPFAGRLNLPARSNESTSNRTTSKSQPKGSLASSSERKRPLAVSP
jgi:hypothetical protein